ncbi:unnamed protein product [Amoebophrya sp. A120]|nr:unnamed protein product [Amoebophrya sp. A120]|eukprot:GSA120T00016093001.1
MTDNLQFELKDLDQSKCQIADRNGVLFDTKPESYVPEKWRILCEPWAYEVRYTTAWGKHDYCLACEKQAGNDHIAGPKHRKQVEAKMSDLRGYYFTELSTKKIPFPTDGVNMRDKFGTVVHPRDVEYGCVQAFPPTDVDAGFVPNDVGPAAKKKVSPPPGSTFASGGGGNGNAGNYYGRNVNREIDFSGSDLDVADQGGGGQNVDVRSMQPMDCYGRLIPADDHWVWKGDVDEEYCEELFTNPHLYEMHAKDGYTILRCRICPAIAQINSSHTPNSNTHRKNLHLAGTMQMECMTEEQIAESRKKNPNMPLPMAFEDIKPGVNCPAGYKKFGTFRDSKGCPGGPKPAPAASPSRPPNPAFLPPGFDASKRPAPTPSPVRPSPGPTAAAPPASNTNYANTAPAGTNNPGQQQAVSNYSSYPAPPQGQSILSAAVITDIAALKTQMSELQRDSVQKEEKMKVLKQENLEKTEQIRTLKQEGLELRERISALERARSSSGGAQVQLPDGSASLQDAEESMVRSYLQQHSANLLEKTRQTRKLLLRELKRQRNSHLETFEADMARICGIVQHSFDKGDIGQKLLADLENLEAPAGENKRNDSASPNHVKMNSVVFKNGMNSRNAATVPPAKEDRRWEDEDRHGNDEELLQRTSQVEVEQESYNIHIRERDGRKSKNSATVDHNSSYNANSSLVLSDRDGGKNHNNYCDKKDKKSKKKEKKERSSSKLSARDEHDEEDESYFFDENSKSGSTTAAGVVSSSAAKMKKNDMKVVSAKETAFSADGNNGEQDVLMSSSTSTNTKLYSLNPNAKPFEPTGRTPTIGAGATSTATTSSKTSGYYFDDPNVLENLSAIEESPSEVVQKNVGNRLHKLNKHDVAAPPPPLEDDESATVLSSTPDLLEVGSASASPSPEMVETGKIKYDDWGADYNWDKNSSYNNNNYDDWNSSKATTKQVDKADDWGNSGSYQKDQHDSAGGSTTCKEGNDFYKDPTGTRSDENNKDAGHDQAEGASYTKYSWSNYDDANIGDDGNDKSWSSWGAWK